MADVDGQFIPPKQEVRLLLGKQALGRNPK